MFQGMRKWAVPQVVKQYRDLCCFIFFAAYLNSFLAKIVQHLSHQMHGSQGVLKPGVLCPRVHKLSQAQLFNVSEPLKVRMRDNVKKQVTFDGDKPVNGIVDDFLFVYGGQMRLNFFWTAVKIHSIHAPANGLPKRPVLNDQAAKNRHSEWL
jgi:hypothetical protein